MNESQPRHILLATDFTARCDRAQDRAVRLALEWQARLTAVHAIDPAHRPIDGERERDLPKAIVRAAELLRREFAAVEGLNGSVQVGYGCARDVIRAAAGRELCDLIVTGVSDCDALGKTLLGSTTSSLIRESGIPVLVVKKKPAQAGDRMIVASDLSEGSRPALQAALDYFRPAALTFMHVLDPPFQNWVDDKHSYRREAQAQGVVDCREFLSRTLRTDAATDVSIVTEVGDPATTLAAYVADHDVDLVVAGTHGRTGAMHVLIGSVAARIAEEVPCDILVVPPSHDGRTA